MKELDIANLTRLLNGGFPPNEFFGLFNTPFLSYVEITNSVSLLGGLINNYAKYFGFLLNDNAKNKREQYLKLMFSDIFAELAVSIKLASEGYIKYSLRNLRAALDLLFAGIYTISSWTEGSVKAINGINPMAEAFFSGYWGKMKVLDIEDIVLSRLAFGEEGQGKMARDLLSELKDEIFESVIQKFNFVKSIKLTSSIRASKESLQNCLEKTLLEMIKNSGSNSGRSAWSQLINESFSPDNFYSTLFSDNRFVFKSCNNHENELLTRLRKKLGILDKLTSEIKENLRSSLTFKGPKFTMIENHPSCDDCKKPATIFGLYSRPDTRGLTKLIKNQLHEDDLNQINSCIIGVFSANGKETKGYFGDIIYNQIYVRLNDYVHSNIVEEPNIHGWFSDFIVPSFGVFNCLLNRLTLMDESVK